MKKTFSVRVKYTITMEAVIYARAMKKDDAVDAARDFAVANWDSIDRKARIGSEYSAYTADATEIEGGGMKVDVEV